MRPGTKTSLHPGYFAELYSIDGPRRYAYRVFFDDVELGWAEPDDGLNGAIGAAVKLAYKHRHAWERWAEVPENVRERLGSREASSRDAIAALLFVPTGTPGYEGYLELERHLPETQATIDAKERERRQRNQDFNAEQIKRFEEEHARIAQELNERNGYLAL